LNSVLKKLGWCWALPLTLIGLPLWLWVRVTRQNGSAQIINSRVGYLLTAHSPTIAAWLRYHPMGHMHAVAVGCCIFASDASALKTHLPHEQVHAFQAQRWGVVFPMAYLASSLWQWSQGRCPYADNYFEKQANQA
jgi:hypothetical protein